MNNKELNKSEPFAQTIRPVRNSAKAIIIENGCLLTTRNRDLFGDFFLLPGGGQHHGETMAEAVARECLEETGANIKVGRLALIREYISANHEFAEFDKTIHQVEFMFICTLEETVGTHAISEFDSMQTGTAWLEIANLQQYRLFPAILIDLLQAHADLKFPQIYLGDVN